MNITDKPSPNFNVRKHPLSMLVLHYTGMESGQAALSRLCDAEAGVSAHYVVTETGQIYALVDEEARAWHAGKGGWRGLDDINSRSIGIEIVNGGHDWPLASGDLPPYPDVQIAAVIALSQGIVARHNIPAYNIIAHSDIAPARKKDPGEHFPWASLAAQNVSLYPKLPSENTHTLLDKNAQFEAETLLKAIGYPLGGETSGAASLADCLTAFQRRFLPAHLNAKADTKANGEVSAPTLSRLRQISADFCDSKFAIHNN